MEPLWRTRAMMPKQAIPAEIAAWLFEAGSLTRRIVQHCQQQFRVEVLSQKWQRPLLNESRRMQEPVDHWALIREVLLYCGDTPWVFARSVLPRRTLSGPRLALAKLGTRPLGEVLFSDPSVVRDEMEVAQIARDQRMFACATRHLQDLPNHVWGRRSVFYLQQKPLLVNEVFLPSLFASS